MAFSPERKTVSIKTPARMPNGVPAPPDKDTPPRMAAAAEGTSTSERPDGDAEARPKLNIDPLSAAMRPENVNAPRISLRTLTPAISAALRSLPTATRSRPSRVRGKDGSRHNENAQHDDAAYREQPGDAIVEEHREIDVVG